MATAAIVVGVTTAASLYSNNQQAAAANATRRAAKRASNIEQRVASINNQREKRKAIAIQRMQQGQLINTAGTEGTFGSSAVQGGLTSGGAGVASAIGFQSSQLAGASAVGSVMQAGADKAAAHQRNAAYAGVVSNAASTYYNKFGQPQ